jgi:quinol monooxygenase YgiN
VLEAYGRHGRIVATPGHGDDLAALLLEAAAVLGKGFPDCKLYLVSRAISDPDSVWVTEVWTDRAAHDASLADERVRAVIARARPIIAAMADGAELRPIGGKGI